MHDGQHQTELLQFEQCQQSDQCSHHCLQYMAAPTSSFASPFCHVYGTCTHVLSYCLPLQASSTCPVLRTVMRSQNRHQICARRLQRRKRWHGLSTRQPAGQGFCNKQVSSEQIVESLMTLCGTIPADILTSCPSFPTQQKAAWRRPDLPRSVIHCDPNRGFKSEAL